MKLRTMGLLGVILCCASTAQLGSPAYAVNINVGTNQCARENKGGHATNWLNGMRNTGTTDTFLSPVVCSVPHSPIVSGTTTASFFVDGDGAGTTCSLYSLNYDGTFLGSASFSGSQATYDAFLSMPAAQVPYYAYVYLECFLPVGGFLRGVTSLQ